ncbi:hypothetical protein MLGJGCBP_04808 [Rhodococcus sp. T7]|nr:hypothetical protein MLGJGCBP_09942 [Rhodococcus sp. T7]KAF0962026.1 hypothetical protein MLGJGCBP_04808 [Rhodococcus sp. T7]
MIGILPDLGYTSWLPGAIEWNNFVDWFNQL